MLLLDTGKLMPQCICKTQPKAAKLMPHTAKLMPQCIFLNPCKLMPHALYFVRCRQINAPVYLLDTGTLMPSVFVKYRQITVFVKRRQINSPAYLLYLLNTG